MTRETGTPPGPEEAEAVAKKLGAISLGDWRRWRV